MRSASADPTHNPARQRANPGAPRTRAVRERFLQCHYPCEETRLRRRRGPSRPARAGLAVALCAALAFGCAYGKRQRDIERTPVTDTGVGARIIYPGQSAAMPGSPAGAPAGASPGSSPDSSAQQGSVTPGSTPVTFIGGASQDEQKSISVHEEPLYYKYLLLPFAVAAAPFVALSEAVRGEPEPGPALPEPEHTRQAPPPPPPPTDYESVRLEAMERELARRDGAAPPPPTAAAPSDTSIGDELAALQRRPIPPRPPEARVASASPSEAGSGERPFAAADGIVDRDGDGRIDQWIFREDGEIVRNAFDDDGDGRAERTLLYDRQTHRIARVEEDLDGDGAVDSWTDYRDGAIVRRRADADQDGNVDSWSYFEDDQIARHESDASGDGFRDRVRFYQSGELVREEQDNDGDGRAELILYYGAGTEVVRRDEDSDGDGAVDSVSHYENGRLARRELIAPAPAPPDEP